MKDNNQAKKKKKILEFSPQTLYTSIDIITIHMINHSKRKITPRWYQDYDIGQRVSPIKRDTTPSSDYVHSLLSHVLYSIFSKNLYLLKHLSVYGLPKDQQTSE